MSAGFVIVAEVIFEQSTQMVFVDNDHMIQTLATNASDYPLHEAILPGAHRCGTNLLGTHSFHSGPEGFAVDSVAVSNDITRSSVFRKCFDDLLCGPNSRRMFRDIEVDHS